MISVWILYCAGASLLVAISGAALEHLLTLRRYPTRWVWAGCLGATLLLTAASGRGEPRAAGGGIAQVSAADAIGPERAANGAAVRAADPPSGMAAALARADSLVLAAWLLASLAVAGWTAVSVLRLNAQRRTWSARTVRGVPVLVSPGVGPATLGLFRHSIVLPEWILSSPESQLDLVLEHEREHIRARDPRLLLLALAAVILVPWNPGMWWQVRRLRLAIEIDCDARVLRRRNDVRRYGDLLLEVGQRATHGGLPVAALAEPRSFLERRIRAMVRVRQRRGPAAAILPAALFVAGILGIAAVPAPAPPTFRVGAATAGAETPPPDEARVPPPASAARLQPPDVPASLQVPRPSCFARYRARSAARSRASASGVAAEATAAPTLTPMTTVVASASWNGRPRAAAARRAQAVAASAEAGSAIRITNSSPPMRAIVSLARTQSRSRSATSLSRASPAAWPWVSLTGLKRSRSRSR